MIPLAKGGSGGVKLAIYHTNRLSVPLLGEFSVPEGQTRPSLFTLYLRKENQITCLLIMTDVNGHSFAESFFIA